MLYYLNIRLFVYAQLLSKMIIGYARTSTIEQQYGFEAQQEQLNKAGVDKLFSEKVSSVSERPQFEAALDFAREGDMLVVTKMDRAFRSIADMVKVISALDAKDVKLQILDSNIDTSTATDRLQLNILNSVAQFEREIMLERQREGIARAKADGKYSKTRKKKASKEQIEELKSKGLSMTAIAKELNISRKTAYNTIA